MGGAGADFPHPKMVKAARIKNYTHPKLVIYAI
jgi:hypothetical protein